LGECTVVRPKILEAALESIDSIGKAAHNINRGHRNLGKFHRELLAAS